MAAHLHFGYLKTATIPSVGQALMPCTFLLLSACSGTPACGDSATLDLLDEIIEEKFPPPNAMRLFPSRGDIPLGARTITIRRGSMNGEAAVWVGGRLNLAIEQAGEPYALDVPLRLVWPGRHETLRV